MGLFLRRLLRLLHLLHLLLLLLHRLRLLHFSRPGQHPLAAKSKPKNSLSPIPSSSKHVAPSSAVNPRTAKKAKKADNAKVDKLITPPALTTTPGAVTSFASPPSFWYGPIRTSSFPRTLISTPAGHAFPPTPPTPPHLKRTIALARLDTRLAEEADAARLLELETTYGSEWLKWSPEKAERWSPDWELS